MKKLFALAAFGLVAGTTMIDPVFASQLTVVHCQSDDVADDGYLFTVNPPYRTAKLEEQSFHGPRNALDLECRLLPVRQFPDALNNYLVCFHGQVRVRVYSGGIAGLHYASVRKVEIRRTGDREVEVQFGRLNCKQ